MESYKLFLESISLIHKKYSILNSSKEDFNIFSILRNEWDEVNLHSKFITELFKNRNFGKIFIQLFLEEIEINNFKIRNVDVFSEYAIKNNGRIDILLKIFGEDGNRKIIIIENKIYADDQNGQLKRYYSSILKEGYSDEEIEIVYLTLNGDDPSEESIKGLSDIRKDKINIISYKNEIINWIEKCIKKTVQIPIIRETLVQYENLLKKLTGREEKNMNEELKEIILSKPEYLEAIYNLPEILLDIKIDLQLRYWEKLEERLNKSLERYGLKLENNVDDYNHYTRDLIEKYYKNKKNNKFYGLMYFIKDIENRCKLYLRIEIDWNIYYGFGIKKDGKNGFIKIDNNFENKLIDLNFDTKKSKTWLGYKYLYITEKSNETINFRIFNKELANILNNKEKLERLISFNVEDIIKTIEYIKEKF